MKTVRAVIFDLDGTLAESKGTMSPEVGTALAELSARVPVAIMSGGAWHQFERQLLPNLPAEAHKDNMYLFPTSAASMYAWKDGEWRRVYAHSFTETEKELIISSIKGGMNAVGFEMPDELWGEQIEDRGAQITFSALGQQAPLAMKKQYDPTGSKRRPLTEYLSVQLPEYSVAQNATTSIDITRKGMDKAYGVKYLAKELGMSPEEMVYVGDALFPGGNDSAVHKTGVQTYAVKTPADTHAFIQSLLESHE